MAQAMPPVVGDTQWREAVAELRVHEKALTREGDAVAAARRRLPMVKMPDYTLVSAEGPVRLADVFAGHRQLVTYHHMWENGATWQCPGCTGFTAQFTRPELVEDYDVRFVVVTQGPIGEALAYRERVGNRMTWYSTADSTFGSDVDASADGGGFALNVFLRDGDDVYRTWYTNGRGMERLIWTSAMADMLPYGRQEEWERSPVGWPQHPTYSEGTSSEELAQRYGPTTA